MLLVNGVRIKLHFSLGNHKIMRPISFFTVFVCLSVCLFVFLLLCLMGVSACFQQREAGKRIKVLRQFVSDLLGI